MIVEPCRNMGLESAKAKGLEFDEKPVIGIERFDRSWQEGVIYRVAQEDMCQALGSKKHCRLNAIQPRHFYQTGLKGGIAQTEH